MFDLKFPAAPTDCYEGDGESYRGVVSVTEEGVECLDWHSYFILRNGDDPFDMYSGFSGLGRNNYCRCVVVNGSFGVTVLKLN